MRKKVTNSKSALGAVVAVFLILGLASGASAADYYWDNGGGDNLWSNSLNWNPDGVPGEPTPGSDWVLIETPGDGPTVNNQANNVYGFYIARGILNVVDGGSLSSKAAGFFAIGSGDTFEINVSGGLLGVNYNRWVGLKSFWLGSDHVQGAGGTATLNVSGGKVTTYDMFLHVGAEVDVGQGLGFINQTGGLIEIWSPPSSTQTLNNLHVECPSGAGISTVTLSGGELASRGFPAVGTNGLIVIDGGKLITRDIDGIDDTVAWAIGNGLITNTSSSTDPNDGTWKIAHVPQDEVRYFEDVITIQSPIPACETNVIPYKEQSTTVAINSTGNFVYTVKNEGINSVSYTVIESPDQPWLTLDKTSGGPIAGSADGQSGGTDTVTAIIDSSSMTPGNYTIDLVFTDNCAQPVSHTRTLNVTVVDCQLGVTPELTNPDAFADITVYSHCQQPQNHTFTVTNSLGAGDRNYTVQEVDAGGIPTDYAWLSLDKTSGGPLPPGSSDTVTVTITGTPNAPGTFDNADTAYLLFTPDCGDAVLRRIDRTDTHIGDFFGFKFTYKGDVNPLDADSCSSIPPEVLSDSASSCNFTLIGAEAGTVVTDINADPDYAAQNNKAFLIDQSTDPQGRNGYASNIINATPPAGYTGDNNHINSRIGTTTVARIKVVTNSAAEAVLWTRDNNNGSGNSPPPGGARVLWGGAGPDISNKVMDAVNGITTADLGLAKPDAYHIVRYIEGYGPYGQHTVKIWMDENPTPVLESSPSDFENENQNDAFCFGTFGTSSNSKVYFDWISFTDAGMYGPGEEDSCIGSLIPAFCPDPFADADGDNDVDQDDFAKFQMCFTGIGGTIVSGCACFDRDGDEDVDANDYTEFENCASGPDIPADPSCDDPTP